MANTSVRVDLDNFAQNGDTTLSQLMTSVAAVNSGDAPAVANPVRDPSTGKLIRVELEMPEASAAAAVLAINANPGVPVAFSCPPGIAIHDLDATTGIAYDGVVAVDQDMFCFAKELAGNILLGQFDEGGYTDSGNSNTNIYTILRVQTGNLAGALTIATTDTLTLNILPTQALTINLNADIVVAAAGGAGLFTQHNYYVDVNGNLYLQSFVNTSGSFGNFDYATACQNGAA